MGWSRRLFRSAASCRHLHRRRWAQAAACGDDCSCAWRGAPGRRRTLADIKEQLGGFYLIEVENLDAALAWAEKCPGAATGSIEVRPLIEMNQ
ncbi:MAG: YciI family protein [Hyphomonadaceae bacterium]|nr:YciI family protein [Hyphomonadaceae bacterium]